ncbi:MAG TPA: MFS transporter [Bacteroidota bacterium]|jgi:MFS family permease
MPAEPKRSSESALKGLRLIFRTLAYRNYRLFFGGQIISLTGTWMQQVALIWLVYRMTNSPFLLGLVGFSGQMPSFLLSPFAGVIADRFNKHRILVITQSLSMLQASVLAALTLTGSLAVWHILALSIFLGVINAFDVPTRQSFLLDMIENRDDISNAIALNSSMFNAARLVGPSIAGIIIATLGEGLCFLLNAVSYLAVIGALLAMKITRRPPVKKPEGVLSGFAEGFRYVFRFKPIRSILLLLALISLMGMPYSTLMPIFARDILHGGAHTLGFLMGATGVGALTGALILASRKNAVGLTRWIPAAAGLFGAGLVAFSLSATTWLSVGLLFIVGLGLMVQMASSNTILQTIAEDDKRGRVMSFYAVSFMGMAPFGSLLAGSLAGTIGAPGTLLISGCACLAGTIVFTAKLPAIRKQIRPIYVKLGLVPEFKGGAIRMTEVAIPPEQ